MLEKMRKSAGNPGKNCSMTEEQEAEEPLGSAAQGRGFGRRQLCLGWEKFKSPA